MIRRASTVALLVLLLTAPACQRVSPVSNTQELEELVVPAQLRLRVGRLALARGQLARALELIVTAPDQPPGAVAAALEPLLAAALAAHRPELVAATLAELEARAPRGPVTRALSLRVADTGTTTVAEQRLIDQRVRQLLADVQAGEEPLADALRARLCSALEALYWDRYERVTEPAYQIDALLAHQSICGRATATERTLAALRAEALAAEEAGRPETAIAFHEQVVSLGARDPAGAALMAEAAEALHRLQWPTHLERANQRFDHHSAGDFAARGLFDEATRELTVEVGVAVPAECEETELAACPSLVASASAALAERLDAVAREAFEMPPRSGGPPVVEPPEPTLARREGATAYFAASLPLDALIRALYESERPPAPD